MKVRDTSDMKAVNTGKPKMGYGGKYNGGMSDPDMPKDPTHLSIAQLQACAPLSMRNSITAEMLNMINADMDDSDVKEQYRENLLSWVNVMQEGRWKFKDYIRACKYVTHKLMGDTQQAAWAKVFPDRLQRLFDKGVSNKKIAAHSSMYNKTDLVIKVTERTLPSLHVMNSDLLQEAINVEAGLMRTAKSETVRMKAAATLIEHLKAPEILKVDLNVGVSNDTIQDLRDVTRKLAVQQRRMIQSGDMSARDVAEMTVIEKEKEDEAEEIIEAEFESMEPSGLAGVKDFFGR